MNEWVRKRATERNDSEITRCMYVRAKYYKYYNEYFFIFTRNIRSFHTLVFVLNDAKSLGTLSFNIHQKASRKPLESCPCENIFQSWNSYKFSGVAIEDIIDDSAKIPSIYMCVNQAGPVARGRCYRSDVREKRILKWCIRWHIENSTTFSSKRTNLLFQ